MQLPEKYKDKLRCFERRPFVREVCCGGLENCMSFYDHMTNIKSDGFNQNKVLGHSRKHPYHPHGGNIIRNNFFSPPPPDSRNSLCGGVWIFSGTTHYKINKKCKSHYRIY